MPAMEPLCRILGIDTNNLSKNENDILEAELFIRICEELKEIFSVQNKDYFRLIKINNEMENVSMEAKFIRNIINDILATEEYSLQGIASYANIPEDVIVDAASGICSDPSTTLLRKIVEIHRTVRPVLYKRIMKKIIAFYYS